MSTRDFRDAEALGVNVVNAGHIEYSLPAWIAFLVVSSIFNLVVKPKEEAERINLEYDVGHVIVAGAPLVMLIFQQREDGRSFYLRAINRLASMALCLSWFVEGILAITRLEATTRYELVVSVEAPFLLVLLSVSVLGLPGVSRLPCCGRGLAQLLVGRGLEHYLPSQLRCRVSETESPSEVSEMESASEEAPSDSESDEPDWSGI
eukprot:TRINITY_DN3524_c1_g1_i1.p1 TRINITY_DN3524_c1_g1~~TRINITY_DN3524_c1_g1_i1.p1  ORF type:complete len:230 (+),score=20.51 TRINITY_DN3524_c1_g1_i1:74-691(+)